MKPQHYGNYTRLVPGFHLFLVPLGLITLTAAVVYLILSVSRGDALFAPILLACLSSIMVMTMIFCRSFACKVQDRAIRSEENMRHFVLTGKLLDPRLSMDQIIALRFASDEEFLALCGKAVNDGMSPDAIKREIKSWRADHNRV